VTPEERVHGLGFDECWCMTTDNGTKHWQCARCRFVVAIRAAVEEEREACARVLDAEVQTHLAEVRQTDKAMAAEGHEVFPHTFCEDYGCDSLTGLAAQIRARSKA
jgi:hypothetical protein